MINMKIQIGKTAFLTTYVRDCSEEIEPNRRRVGILVLPGGGYSCTSDREAEPIALEFLSRGYNAFVLRYTCNAPYPTQLREASEAMALMRKNADEWNLFPNKLLVCGFSSGGHLAASLGTLWNRDEVVINGGDNRPDGLILGYPVISADPSISHVGSFEILNGDNKILSLENSVGAHTPPAFIWHTNDDPCVNSGNSICFAESLRRHNIPFELHLYQTGPHGLSLGKRETASPNGNRIIPYIQSWFDLCCNWIKLNFDE